MKSIWERANVHFPHSSLAARQKDLKKFVTPAPGMYEVGLLSYYKLSYNRSYFGLESFGKFIAPAPGIYEVGLLSYYRSYLGLECLISKI